MPSLAPGYWANLVVHHNLPPIPLGTFGQDFGSLLETGMLSDVTFRVQGEALAAHRVVLIAVGVSG